MLATMLILFCYNTRTMHVAFRSCRPFKNLGPPSECICMSFSELPTELARIGYRFIDVSGGDGGLIVGFDFCVQF